MESQVRCAVDEGGLLLQGKAGIEPGPDDRSHKTCVMHQGDRKLVLWQSLCERYALVTSTIWNVDCVVMGPGTTGFHAPSKSQGSREPGSLLPYFVLLSFFSLFVFLFIL